MPNNASSPGQRSRDKALRHGLMYGRGTRGMTHALAMAKAITPTSLGNIMSGVGAGPNRATSVTLTELSLPGETVERDPTWVLPADTVLVVPHLRCSGPTVLDAMSTILVPGGIVDDDFAPVPDGITTEISLLAVARMRAIVRMALDSEVYQLTVLDFDTMTACSVDAVAEGEKAIMIAHADKKAITLAVKSTAALLPERCADAIMSIAMHTWTCATGTMPPLKIVDHLMARMGNAMEAEAKGE